MAIKPSSRGLHLALRTLAVLTGLVAVFGWLTWRQYLRVRLRGPLIAAVVAKDAGTGRSLLDRGADPNARDQADRVSTGLRGLLLAPFSRDPDGSSKRGKTALMLAAANADPACVRLLLDRGADVNARDGFRITALMDAVLPSKVTDDGLSIYYADPVDFDGPRRSQVLKLLLDRGADVNARDSSGNTALDVAFLAYDAATCGLLRRAGAKE